MVWRLKIMYTRARSTQPKVLSQFENSVATRRKPTIKTQIPVIFTHHTNNGGWGPQWPQVNIFFFLFVL